MHILVLGASGMLGHKILMKLAGKHELAGTVRTIRDSLKNTLCKLKDISIIEGVDAFDFKTVRTAIETFKPDAVINCVGIVKQLDAAKDRYTSIAINAFLPHQLEKLSAEKNFRLIHFSTDCVFSGIKGPYSEENQSDVHDLYGQTKYLGEVSGAKSLTLRTSIIGREINPPYTGLIEWFLAQDGKAANGFTGALYTGLTTNAMADLVDAIPTKNPGLRGLYHVSADAINKHDLLAIVRDIYGLKIDLKPDDLFHCDRRLDSTRFRTETGWAPMGWAEMIKAMHDEDKILYGMEGHRNCT